MKTSFNITTVYSDGSSGAIGDESLTVYLSDFATPQTLWDLYNIVPNTVVSHPNATQSVAEFLGQYYSPQDLSSFFQ